MRAWVRAWVGARGATGATIALDDTLHLRQRSGVKFQARLACATQAGRRELLIRGRPHLHHVAKLDLRAPLASLRHGLHKHIATAAVLQ